MGRGRDVHFCDEVSPNVQFLLESYSDTQDVIQFFDTKVGAYVALIGVLASLLMSSLVRVLTELAGRGVALTYVLLAVLGALSLAFLYQLAHVFYRAFQVLFPRHGPALMKKGKALGLFSASDIHAYLQGHTLEEYSDAVDRMSEQELIAELSYEAAKLSEIASVKLEHLDKATNHCKWAVLLWVVLLVTVACLEIMLPQIP